MLASACSSDAPVVHDAPPASIDAPPGTDPYDGARSGTRLKLTWFDFADGSRQWDGFYDAERKETCYIYDNWIDGKSYCAPDYGGAIVYTNAACTQKAAEFYRDTTCPQAASPYALEYAYTPCDSQPAHLYTRGTKLALAQYYDKNSDGSCGGPYTTLSSFDYYAVGGEVLPSALVEVTQGSPVGPGRLAVRYWQSPDGMRLQASVHDAMLGEACYPQIFATGATTGSCVPDARYAAYNHDSACMQHEIAVDKQCAMPKYAVYYPQNTCPADPPLYYTIGASLPSSPLYQESGASCVARTGSSSYNYFAVGTQLSPAPVTRAVGATQSRLQLIHFTDGGGLSYRSYYLHDSQKDADCYPTKLPDGTMRCVVFGGYVATFYQDSGCTQPIDLVEVSTGPASCGAPTVPKYARKYLTPSPGSCTYNTQVFPVSTPYAGTVYWQNGGCVAYAPTESKLYSIGPQVPLEEFVMASQSIDQ